MTSQKTVIPNKKIIGAEAYFTVGKSYGVMEETEKAYIIIDDTGKKGGWLKTQFKVEGEPEPAWNSILVERVLLAYESGLLKPYFDGWGNEAENCGCAMTAVLMYEKSNDYPTVECVLNDIDNCGAGVMCTELNVSRPYMLGFTDAFDGGSFGTSNDGWNEWDQVDKADYKLGYEQGQAAQVAVYNKYFLMDA